MNDDCCAECGRSAGTGWALYCTDCVHSTLLPAFFQDAAIGVVARLLSVHEGRGEEEALLMARRMIAAAVAQ